GARHHLRLFWWAASCVYRRLWRSRAGGVVVLISALLLWVLAVWPQPLISLVHLAMPLM
ncbi:hypothetical protein, partial [Salmonella enterica]|uniref:hypothetical protein n=1 Tax=Salmonella enterica TaxID=28901 RepID=UPI000A853773